MSANPETACSFRLDGRLFGFEISMVREVHPMAPMVPVPAASAGFLGLVNLRGAIHLVLDMRLLLGLPEKVPAAGDLLVLFNASAGPAFGVVVDEIGGIEKLSGPSLECPGPLVVSVFDTASGGALSLVRPQALLAAAADSSLVRGAMP